MEYVEEKLTNGNTIKYKIINGTAYHADTPDRVVSILENAMKNHKRIRVFYGDAETGRDWHEEHDVIGTIGRSGGRIKIPLLIKTARSYGGGAVLDNCIVKITCDRKGVYEHPKYHVGELTYGTGNMVDLPFEVNCDGENIARFVTEKEAVNYIAFLKGERNRI